ncbi:MAG: hypothetical protein H6733_02710 [Alphaproteobacteria bacterium]|nr:hypothetical protein [Alphaproteobacteria bacterium]
MRKFEYLVAFTKDDRVLLANGNWQGEIARSEADAELSCPSLFDWLAHAGAQGWELVAVDPEETGTAQLYLKRVHEL